MAATLNQFRIQGTKRNLHSRQKFHPEKITKACMPIQGWSNLPSLQFTQGQSPGTLPNDSTVSG